MKKTKNFSRILTVIVMIALFSMLFSLNCFAEETPTSTGIQLNPDFDANALLRSIVNVFIAVITLVGIIYGCYQIFEGFGEQDPSRKRTGITVIVGSLLIGGSLMAFVNMVIL